MYNNMLTYKSVFPFPHILLFIIRNFRINNVRLTDQIAVFCMIEYEIVWRRASWVIYWYSPSHIEVTFCLLSRNGGKGKHRGWVSMAVSFLTFFPHLCLAVDAWTLSHWSFFNVGHLGCCILGIDNCLSSMQSVPFLFFCCLVSNSLINNEFDY